jgi:hypothetical protein
VTGVKIGGMNGFGTVRTRPLPPGFLSAGWLGGNAGENRVVQALSQAGITPATASAMSSPATSSIASVTTP